MTAPTLTAPVAARLRGTSAAAGGYVAAWLVGLALAPSRPDPDAPSAEVAAFYADHGTAVLTSSALVHGAAGVALGALALLLVRATRADGGLARAVAGTGLTAAGLSLVQLVLAAVAVAVGDAALRVDLFRAVDRVDVVKVAALAGFVAVATTAAARAGAAPRWLRAHAALLVPTLVVGSTALVVVSPVLMGALALSLVGLLVWAGAIAATVARATR